MKLIRFGVFFVLGYVLTHGAIDLFAQAAEGRFARIWLDSACMIREGTGSPESVVTGSICDMFYRSDGGSGTAIYVKESGAATTTGWVAVAGISGTATLTGKTLDVEGTGNVITVPFRDWYPAATCNDATAATTWSLPTGSAKPALACITGSNTQRGVIDFDDTNDENVQRHIRLPADWAGAVDVIIFWHTTATTGNAVWQVSTICVADDETSDPAYNTASTVTDAAKGTTTESNQAAITGVTTTGCAAGEILYLKVQRNPAHASDTIAATARFQGIEVTLRRAM